MTPFTQALVDFQMRLYELGFTGELELSLSKHDYELALEDTWLGEKAVTLHGPCGPVKVVDREAA